jgi:hypothetical protein
MFILHSDSSDKEADPNLNFGNLNERDGPNLAFYWLYEEDEPNLDLGKLYTRGLQVKVTVNLPTWFRETPCLYLCDNTGYYNFSWLTSVTSGKL